MNLNAKLGNSLLHYKKWGVALLWWHYGSNFQQKSPICTSPEQKFFGDFSEQMNFQNGRGIWIVDKDGKDVWEREDLIWGVI